MNRLNTRIAASRKYKLVQAHAPVKEPNPKADLKQKTNKNNVVVRTFRCASLNGSNNLKITRDPDYIVNLD